MCRMQALEFSGCGPVSVLESPLYSGTRLRLNALYPSISQASAIRSPPQLFLLFRPPTTLNAGSEKCNGLNSQRGSEASSRGLGLTPLQVRCNNLISRLPPPSNLPNLRQTSSRTFLARFESIVSTLFFSSMQSLGGFRWRPFCFFLATISPVQSSPLTIYICVYSLYTLDMQY